MSHQKTLNMALLDPAFVVLQLESRDCSSCKIRSTWNCGVACESCPHSLNTSDWRLVSGMARVRLADLNGPKWTSPGRNGPKWAILVHFGLANAKRTILDHFGPVHFPTAPRPLPMVIPPISQKEIYPVQSWRLETPRNDFSRPQPQH